MCDMQCMGVLSVCTSLSSRSVFLCVQSVAQNSMKSSRLSRPQTSRFIISKRWEGEMRGHHSFPSWTQYKSRWTCVSVRHRQFPPAFLLTVFVLLVPNKSGKKERKKKRETGMNDEGKRKKGKHIHRYMHTQKQEMGEYMPLTQTDRREFYFLSSSLFSRKHRVHLMQRNLSLTDLLSHSLASLRECNLVVAIVCQKVLTQALDWLHLSKLIHDGNCTETLRIDIPLAAIRTLTVVFSFSHLQNPVARQHLSSMHTHITLTGQKIKQQAVLTFVTRNHLLQKSKSSSRCFHRSL